VSVAEETADVLEEPSFDRHPAGLEPPGAVLDSFALLALLRDEPGADLVQEWLEDARAGRARLVMSWVNAGEVLYILRREGGSDAFVQARSSLSHLPISFITVFETDAIEAARLKARYRISYADAFCAALARIHDYPILTGDPELAALTSEVRVRWV